MSGLHHYQLYEQVMQDKGGQQRNKQYDSQKITNLSKWKEYDFYKGRKNDL